jgi:hypothetical protein
MRIYDQSIVGVKKCCKEEAVLEQKFIYVSRWRVEELRENAPESSR